MNCHIFTKLVYRDDRGHFIEQFNCTQNILNFQIKQISESLSVPYTFRGFHFQIQNKMNKVMRVVSGKAQIYTINLLDENPTVQTFELSSIDSNYTTNIVEYLYIPSTYAVGFITLENTRMQYFHDEVRGEHTRSINILSVKNQIPLFDSIQILSDGDKNAMSWEEWKSLHEEEWIV